MFKEAPVKVIFIRADLKNVRAKKILLESKISSNILITNLLTATFCIFYI